MSTEKIPATSFNGKKEKVGKEEPDEKAFKKLMQIEKTGEVEFEKKKKKQKFSDKDLIPNSKTFLEKEVLPEIKKKSKPVLQTEIKKRKPVVIKPKIEKPKISLKKKITYAKKKIISAKEPKISPKKPSIKKEKKKTKEKTAVFEIPKAIQKEIAPTIAKAAPMITSKELLPLLETFIGVITISQKNGIEKTEVTLNNPKFSRFFGAKIIIEKYATAPDSFNIKLIGTSEAVTVYNNNLGNLQGIFRNLDLDFSVNLLPAEHEKLKPLIRRKKELKDFGEKK